MGVLFSSLAYLGGSVPTGLLVGRWTKGVDIRKYGSGNIGTTNVLRVIGARWAVVVFFLDAAKGFLPVYIGKRYGLGPATLALVALLAVAGHNWSVFLRFRGGKGVATSLGTLLALSPVAAVGAAATWGLAVLATGYASVGSMLGLALSGPILFLTGSPPVLGWLGAGLFVMTVYQHRANIKRLAEGRELRILYKKPPAEQPEPPAGPSSGPDPGPGPGAGPDPARVAEPGPARER